MFARGRILFSFVFKRLALAVNVLGTAGCRGNGVVFFSPACCSDVKVPGMSAPGASLARL